MSIPDLCIYFTIAILSVAYPILLQVISRLDEKYSSIIIVDLFKKELEWKLFKPFLMTTLLLTGLYSIINLSIVLSKVLLLNQIIVYFLLLSTSLLIVCFLSFVSKILIYYTPAKIAEYFMNQKLGKDFEYFRALGDILYFSIEQQKEEFAKIIQDYFYKSFLEYRNSAGAIPVIYPQPFYDLIGNIISRLAPLKNRRFGFLEHRTVGGIWLIGEVAEVEISENTYSQLWYNLIIAVNFERDDMIMQYWSTAHQHFTYHLNYISPIYGDGGPEEIKNKQAVDKRNKERERFLEFNQALLGLLLYKNRLNCIKRIFSYTSSTPPRFILLPITMTDVFKIFFRFWDPYEQNFPFITFKYWYPETEGINSEGLVKMGTCNYSALLFLRQYSIVKYYTYIEPFVFPEIPKIKLERKIWIENLKVFKQLVLDIYNNKELLKAVGLGFLTKEWIEETDKPHPIIFIENVLSNVKEQYSRSEYEQELDIKKIEEFESSTKEIIESAIRPFFVLFNNKIEQEYKSYFLKGLSGLLDKNAFVSDQEADYGNFHSIYASSLGNDLKEQLINQFLIQKVKRYSLVESELFTALNKLNIDCENFIIINLGLDLKYIGTTYGIADFRGGLYKGIEIINLPFIGRGLGRKLYVIKKSDLPQLSSLPLQESEISKFHLKRLSEEYEIYGSIIDLYRQSELRDEYTTKENKDLINTQVMVYIGIQLKITWASLVNIGELTPYYSYLHHDSTPNSLDDIKVFE